MLFGYDSPLRVSWSTSVQAAEKLLILLGALDKSTKKITAVGRAMAKCVCDSMVSCVIMCRFPIAPRFAKMMSLAAHYDVLPFVATVVAAMSVRVWDGCCCCHCCSTD
jgi:ATP-dependent RNA helicase DHX37/DHR1